jgi:hypothetical protein
MSGSQSRRTVALAAFVILVVASSCDDQEIPTSPLRSVSARASVAGLETVFGPEGFQRGTGAPAAIVRDISTDGFEAPFVLHVRNGDADGSRRVSSATVMLDGVTLFGPSDFNQQQGGERTVTVSPGANARLSVHLGGKPGSVVYVHLEGKRSGTPYCPTGAGGAFTDLGMAIAATPVGGTVIVCDGVYAINPVLVDKAVTIRAKNIFGTTFKYTVPNVAMMRIADVASGLVRLVGLRFETHRYGIWVDGVYDKVVVDSAHFVGPQPAVPGSIGIFVRGTPAPTAKVEIGDNQIAAYTSGVVVTAPVETNLRRSHIYATTFAGISYESQTGLVRGTTEASLFHACNPGTCVRVRGSGGSGIVIRGNRMHSEHDYTAAAIDLVPNPSGVGVPITVEDNDIISRRLTWGGPENAPTGWGFGAGVRIFGIAGQRHLVLGNRITGAHYGAQILGETNMRDNVVKDGYYLFSQQTGTHPISVRFNDAINLIGSFTSFIPQGDFTCNWWGSAAGPTNPQPADPASFTPVASAAIAGTGAVSCP